MSNLEREAVLSGWVALATGVASGIGRETARVLCRSGAAIAAIDRQAAGVEQVVNEVRALGAEAKGFTVDLADVNALPALVADVLSALSRIDILVNCAGIAGVDGEMQGTLNFSEVVFEAVMAVNLRAPFVLTREIGKHMADRGGGGRIVNVSSSAAFQAAGVPVVYASSKAALNALTRVAAADLAPHGINVNAVAPGLTKTPIAPMTDDQYDTMVRAGPLANLTHRASEAVDVANVIHFLCLPASREITGQVIHTSGGLIV